MMNLLQNKNWTDLSIITFTRSKWTLDHNVILFFYFFDWVYFARLIFSGNKKELSQKKKTNYFVCVFYSKIIVPNKNASLLRPRPFALHPYSVGLRSTFVGGVLFYVQCLWVCSKQRPPAEIRSLRGGMRMKHKQNADAKGTIFLLYCCSFVFVPVRVSVNVSVNLKLGLLLKIRCYLSLKYRLPKR